MSIPYESQFQAGEHVRVADTETLLEFREKWRLHNPLTEEQLRFAGNEAVVAEVGFYHGGDALYRLDGVPGVWHGACLRSKMEQA